MSSTATIYRSSVECVVLCHSKFLKRSYFLGGCGYALSFFEWNDEYTLFFLVFLLSLVVSCASPKSEPFDTTGIEKQIASAFGTMERNADGIIVGIDLSRERSSANNDVLQASLPIPHLTRFRFAGGSVASECPVGLKKAT